MTEHYWLPPHIEDGGLLRCQCGVTETLSQGWVYLDKPHGLSGYVHGKCRCHVCKAGNSASQARWRAKNPNHRVKQNQYNAAYKKRVQKPAKTAERTEANILPSDWTY